MAISQEEVERIARLARLKFDGPEKTKLQTELSAILNYVDQLKEVEAKVSESEFETEGANLMRDDVAEVLIDREELLGRAPTREGNFFKVKSVLD
ncbi:MAG: Asp-tRNA(Asn)/Glu-tRNA(Gln) amidotransferase subunit GatC [Candidatus Doudnabacteria bacterium]|nr:Asp-tRNA(Asn)/Glu-tRNA(Gln) amidotransferase subunit GatC [Candidatus Doudnabacteria bacterium]